MGGMCAGHVPTTVPTPNNARSLSPTVHQHVPQLRLTSRSSSPMMSTLFPSFLTFSLRFFCYISCIYVCIAIINLPSYFNTSIKHVVSIPSWCVDKKGLFSSFRGSTICKELNNHIYIAIYITGNSATWGRKGENGDQWQSERTGVHLLGFCIIFRGKYACGGVLGGVCGCGMMLGKQGARCCLSMYLYREEEEVVTCHHT